MGNKELIEEISAGLADTYDRHRVVFVKGLGPWLWDVEGKIYMDFLCCYSTVNAGHCHPRIVRAVREQAGKLDAVSGAAYHEGLIFAKELAEFCGYDKALLMNSGAEAVERIIKIARKRAYIRMGIPRNRAKIIVCEDNFHGRTYGVLSASTEPHYTKNFGPFLPGFIKIPFNDTGALKKAIDGNTCAFLVEPIQAEGGIIIPDQGYLSRCKEICEKAGILFILDEIQTGMGRTGKILCGQHENVKPHLSTVGKFIGGGQIPVSAVLGDRGIIDILEAGEDGSTHSGFPPACAVGREVLRILKEERLEEKAAKTGEYLIGKLREIKSQHVKEIRGKGLLIGIELKPEAGGAKRFCQALLEKGIFCKEAHTHVIRLAPPLNISIELIDKAVGKFKEVLR